MDIFGRTGIRAPKAMGLGGAEVTITGIKELDAKLKQLERTYGISISKACMTGMATPYKKAIRRSVNATSNSARLKRAARSTVNSRIKRLAAKQGYELKVGFGVGKQTKAKRGKASARAKLGKKGGGGRGVGISANNVHWIVFGTGKGSVLAGTTFKTPTSGIWRKSRATGEERKTKKGHPTGSTAAYFKGLIPVAIMQATPDALANGVIKAKVAAHKEALKGR